MEALIEQLRGTLSPDRSIRTGAEAALARSAPTQGFTTALLSLAAEPASPPEVRLAAAVYLKNHVSRVWAVASEETDVITAAERADVRAKIVDAMLSSPAKVGALLQGALAVIARTDFPKAWPELLPGLVARLGTQDWGMINGALEAMHAVFSGYPSSFKNPKLLEELLYVLPIVAEPLTGLWKASCEHVQRLAAAGPAGAAELGAVFKALRTMCRVFYCLTYVDLPEYFEDHLSEWMAGFHVFLAAEPGSLATDNDDEEDPVTRLQESICEAVNVFIAKYEEEMEPFLNTCTQDVWTLLMRAGREPKFDGLVSAAIAFLTAVARGVHHKIIGEEATLRTLSEAVVVPNVTARVADVESFEDSPIEFIRGDFEGSDGGTRRRAACDLVRGLCAHYEREVVAIFSRQVTDLVAAHRSDGSNWRAKDAAIQLMIAIGSRASTAMHGVTKVADGANVAAFLDAEVLPEISAQAAARAGSPLVTAAALKYLTVFRNHLGKERLASALPGAIELFASEHHVVLSYASLAVDLMLTVRDRSAPTAGKLFTPADLRPHLQAALGGLLQSLERPGPLAQNDYVMRAVMRVASIAQAEIAPLVRPLVGKIAQVLSVVAANPVHPTFNHYLFESTSAIIRHACAADKSLLPVFEEALFPIFQRILEADIAEFTPYVFQVMSQLLELHTELSDTYRAMLPMLLMAQLWELRGNVLPLSRLLVAYLSVGGEFVHSSGAVAKYLGVVQKLVASPATEDGALYILSGMFARLPFEAYAPHFPALLQMLFQRLQSAKTVRYMKSLVVLLSLFIVRAGGSQLVAAIDGIQAGLFLNLLDNVWLSNVCKVDGSVDRKLCAIALGKLLAECPEMVNNENLAPAWPRVLAAAMSLVNNAVDTSSADREADEEEAFIEIDDAGYNNVYAALHNATSSETDHVPEVTDPRAYLNELVSNAAKQNPTIAQHVQGLASGNV